MRGLPKIHKAGVPLRPITSGIGRAPHWLAKAFAKPLSVERGKISTTHLKNSSYLLTKVQDINTSGKILVSFDVKSLFTSVPVDGAMRAIEEVLNEADENRFPLRNNDFVKIVSLCIRFGAFRFNNADHLQHEGLAMGSPLSAILANVYIWNY